MRPPLIGAFRLDAEQLRVQVQHFPYLWVLGQRLHELTPGKRMTSRTHQGVLVADGVVPRIPISLKGSMEVLQEHARMITSAAMAR